MADAVGGADTRQRFMATALKPSTMRYLCSRAARVDRQWRRSGQWMRSKIQHFASLPEADAFAVFRCSQALSWD